MMKMKKSEARRRDGEWARQRRVAPVKPHRRLADSPTRLLALVCIFAAACSGAKPKAHDEKIPVTVATAQSKNVPLEIDAIGNVQAFSKVDVKALASGQLSSVSFREGDDVRRGQLLFTIDPRPYQAQLAQAQANLARDEAQLRNAESEASRYAELVKKDYVTREEYEKFTSAAAAARAVVAADRAAIQTSSLQLSYCEIRSPIDGRTGSLMVHPGNIIKANDTTPLVTINQITPVYVQFSIPESELPALRSRGIGNIPATATPQGNNPPVTGGRLSFIDNSVDPTTGTITLKATFPNQNRALWPGQYVNVSMTVGDRPNAVVVPSQAVQSSQKGQFVFVVKEGDAVEMRPIGVFKAIDNETIVDHGLNAGETVVTDGQLKLTAKSKIEVKR